MKITEAQIRNHFHAQNISTFSTSIDGIPMLVADAGNGAAGIPVVQEEGVAVVREPFQVYTSAGWNDGELKDIETQSFEALVENVMEVLGVDGKQEHRNVIPCSEAEEELSKRGFKAFTEHTGGGTFTVYCSKGGNGILMIGPVSHWVGNQAILSNDECYWGMGDYYTNGNPAFYDSKDSGDIYNMFDKISEAYDQAIASGEWPEDGGGYCDLIAPDHPDFEELPSQLK